MFKEVFLKEDVKRVKARNPKQWERLLGLI